MPFARVLPEGAASFGMRFQRERAFGTWSRGRRLSALPPSTMSKAFSLHTAKICQSGDFVGHFVPDFVKIRPFSIKCAIKQISDLAITEEFKHI